MIGVLMMNLGGPDSLEAVQPFLRNLFEDVLPGPSWLKKPLASFIAWQRAPLSRSYYAQIGGRSPIVTHTLAQARALEQALATAGVEARCEPAMRFWRPFTAEAVARLRAAGARRLAALPLYPHVCKATTGSSYAALDEALTAEERGSLARVGSYAEEPGYLDALAATVKEALAQAPGAHVLFSAHSVPASYTARGDPYQRETEATFRGVVARLPAETRASLAWQSRVGPVKWLAPFTDRELRRLAAEGQKSICLVPISFVSDHIETVQEIDIRYKELAGALGFTTFVRARALNDDPQFIATLAELVLREISPSEARPAPQAASRAGCEAAVGERH